MEEALFVVTDCEWCDWMSKGDLIARSIDLYEHMVLRHPAQFIAMFPSAHIETEAHRLARFRAGQRGLP